MAYYSDSDEELDLRFLEEDCVTSGDQVDAASRKVIDVDKDCQIPLKFMIRKIFSPHQEPHYHFQPAKEMIQRRRKVHVKWGECLPGGVVSCPSTGMLALLTLEAVDDPVNLKPSMVNKILDALEGYCQNGSVKVVRWSGTQLLVHFSSVQYYEDIGKVFYENKLDSCMGFKIIKIQPVSLVNPPRCYLEVLCSMKESYDLQGGISALLAPFCSAFHFLKLRESSQEESSSDGRPSSPQPKQPKIESGLYPSFGIVLMFSPSSQKNAVRLEKYLHDATHWVPVKELKHIIPSDEKCFELTEHQSPLWFLKCGCPLPGVRIVVYINNKVQEMEHFYRVLTGITPYVRDLGNDKPSFRTFTLSKAAELHLVHYPGIRFQSLPSLSLCFRIGDVNAMMSQIPGGLENLGEDHWRARDPEGNVVILYMALS